MNDVPIERHGKLDMKIIPGTNGAGIGVAMCGGCSSLHVGVVVQPQASIADHEDSGATVRFLSDGRVALQIKLDRPAADKLLAQLTQLIASVA